MSTGRSTSSPSRPAPAAGWDRATFRCGQCGAVRTARTEDAYLEAVDVHHDAHALMARLNPIERDGLASILRVVLAAPELGTEFLALIDNMPRPTRTTTTAEGSDA